MALDIKSNVTTINQWSGRGKFDIRGICLHSCWGTYKGTLSWFKNPAARASTHYVISKDGEISLCILEENTAWAQGNVTTTKEKAPGVIREYWGVNPNFVLISVEFEDCRDKNWNYPTPQYMAAISLVADICRRYKIETTRDYIIMHKELDPINRSDPVGKWDHDKFCSDVAKLLKYDKPKLKEIPYIETVHIRTDTIGWNVRSGPTTIAPKTGKVRDYVLPGETVNVIGYVVGEDVDGESRWWVTEYKNYISMKATVEKPVEQIKKSGGEYNMTLQEKEDLLKELEARIAEVNEVPVEEPAVEVAPEAPVEVVTEEMVAADPIVVEEPVEETVEETVEVVEPEVEVPAEPVVETPADLPVEEVAVEDNTRGAVVEDYNAKLTAVEKELSALKSWIKQASMKIGVGF